MHVIFGGYQGIEGMEAPREERDRMQWIWCCCFVPIFTLISSSVCLGKKSCEEDTCRNFYVTSVIAGVCGGGFGVFMACNKDSPENARAIGVALACAFIPSFILGVVGLNINC